MVKVRTRKQFWNHIESIGKQCAENGQEKGGILYVNYALYFGFDGKAPLRGLKEALNSHLDFMLKKLTKQIDTMKVK